MATKRIRIACKAIEEGLKQGNEISAIIKQGLPDDAYITDVRFDQYNRVVEIDVQGSFESRVYADFAIVAEPIEAKQMPAPEENKMVEPAENKALGGGKAAQRAKAKSK